MQQAETFLNGEDWQIRLEMNNGVLKKLERCGKKIHYSQNGGKGILIQNQMNKDIIHQNLGENITKVNNEYNSRSKTR